MTECNFCGETLSAANDEDLKVVVRRHMDEQHSDAAVDDRQVSDTVERDAYSATDS